MTLARWTSRFASMVAVVAMTWLALVFVLPAPLAAAPTSSGGCFYVPASALAKATGFEHAASYLDTEPNPTDNAPSVFSLCRAVAWEGSVPTTIKEVHEKIARKEGVGVLIKTEEPNPSATAEQAEQWEEEYIHEVTNFIKAASAFAKITHGSAVTLPSFGAEYNHAFTVAKGPKRGALGIWYDEKSHAFITVGIYGGINDAQAALGRVAAKAVPSFGL